MANMCSNNVVFYGDQHCITELYNRVNQIFQNKNNPHNDYTMLAQAYGLEIAEAGWFEYIDDEPTQEDDEVYNFTLQTETKWVPKEEIFDAICKHYEDKIQYVYIAEEIGFEVFVNTDKEGRYFQDKYYVDGSGMDEPLYAVSWYEVIVCLKEYVFLEEDQFAPDDLNELNAYLRNALPKHGENDTNLIQVYKYEEEFK